MKLTLQTNTTARRGNVLIFVLAILAVLALLGATYITRANLDRVSAAASAQRSSLERQPEVVVDHIRALLTADLFGNKIVTDATPRLAEDVETSDGSVENGPVDIWPRMFEDGEYWDYPSVDEVEFTRDDVGSGSFYTFARSDGGDPDRDPPKDEGKLRYDRDIGIYQTAFADDAWLAATEPVDSTGVEPLGSYAGGWNTWPQISNVRSAYRWDADADGRGSGAWVRDDGRFADLASFFLSDTASMQGRGDPGADLLDRADTRTPFYDPSSNNSVLNLDPQFNSALLGVEQREVYGFQMNQLGEWYENAALNPDAINELPYEAVDERFWADTDGDGRPDARWQVIDEMAGAEGLIWVAAVRIVDSSSAVNMNTSLEYMPEPSGGADAEEVYGDGSTPADIDVYRLLYEASFDSAANSASVTGTPSLRHPDINNLSGPALIAGFNQSLINGLDLKRFVEAEVVPNYFSDAMTNEVDQVFIGWNQSGTADETFLPDLASETTARPTTRAQREAYWRLFAARPGAPLVRGARQYELSEEADLRAALGSTSPGTVTKLESIFDGPDAVGPRLQGDTPAYPDRRSLGPLRSSEYPDAVNASAMTGLLRPEGLPGMNFTQGARIERIQKDVRRSLTMTSGASARSIVPALNGASGRQGLKPIINDLGTRNAEAAVQESFEALVWALAPLATDKPLRRDFFGQPGMNPWATLYPTYATDPDFHYGGGTNGPARAWATELSATPDTLGPSYAIWRAASMAVNLVDAVDDEGVIPQPTVARLFTSPAPNLTGFNAEPSATDGAVTLTTRFAHGSIGDANGRVNGMDVIPTAVSAQDNFGVSFVGLDRQPFLSQVYAICLYEYTETGFPTPMMPPAAVDIQGPGDTVGRAILGVELINPWDDDLSLVGYRLMLTDGAEQLVMDLDTVTVGPGERHVVVWPSFEETDPAEAVFADTVTSFETALTLNGAAFTRLTPPAPTDMTFDDNDDPFESWNRSAVTALLYREGVPNATSQVLVDRLVPPATATDMFPLNPSDVGLTTANVITTDTPPVTDVGARFVTASRLARSSGFAATGGGFPIEVIERSSTNAVNQEDTSPSVNAEGWHTDASALADHVTLFSSGWLFNTLGETSGVTNLMLQQPFSLFVPDGRFVSLAEMGMVSTFAHTYRHASEAAPTVTVDDVNTTLSAWSTVSEQLGKDYHLNYNGTLTGAPPTGTEANPFLGVLDPTRYILGANGDLEPVASLPDSFSIPLALRVYDAFEALGEDFVTPSEPLIPGRINLNTAPKRVLATLPYVLPVDYRNGMIPTDLSAFDIDTAYARLNAIVQYRDRLGPAWSSGTADLGWNDYDYTTPDQLTTLSNAPDGLRVAYQRASSSMPVASGNANSHRKGRGFVSAGELSILNEWSNTSSNAPTVSATSSTQGFQELAVGMTDNTLDATTRNALDSRPSAEFDAVSLEGTDDVEERLAQFRAVANVAGTRSDVFHAYYILRAYAPQEIEAIAVSASASPLERAELLNELTPAFQRRGVVVLDRSNVALPTDRPRVLLRARLGLTSAGN